MTARWDERPTAENLRRAAGRIVAIHAAIESGEASAHRRCHGQCTRTAECSQYVWATTWLAKDEPQDQAADGAASTEGGQRAAHQ